MRYTIKEPRHPNNDRFILSKGHAAPILYAAWAEAGLFPTSQLLDLRKLSSDLEGHPTPVRYLCDMLSKTVCIELLDYPLYLILKLFWFYRLAIGLCLVRNMHIPFFGLIHSA